MKKLSCLDSVAIIVSFLMLSACHQHEILQGAERGCLTIVVDNFVCEGPSKTIAPAPITLAQLQGQNQYKLRLKGTSGRLQLPEQDIALANGRTTLPNIPEGLWELVLTAYDAAGTVPLLQGRTTVRVDPVGGAVASFLLSPVGLAGTGTVSLTVNWNAGDLAAMQSDTTKSRHWRLGLYYRGTDTLVPGTEEVYNRDANHGGSIPTTLTYSGSSQSIPAGEYEFRFRMWGGGVAAGTTLQWQDNLYIDPGRQTTGTVTIPQLVNLPAAPPYLISYSGEAEGSDKSFSVSLGWGNGRIYNNETYKLEILSFPSGTLPTNDADWNARLAAGGKVYSYDEFSLGRETAKNPYPVSLIAGGLGKEDTTMDLDLVMENNRFYCARICSSNASGSSRWVYLQNLLMSQPVIDSHTSTKANIKVWAGGRQVETWNVTLTIGQTTWGSNYEISWLRLGAGDSLSDYIYDDAAWLEYQVRDGQGKRNVAKSNTISVEQLDKDRRFVFRIRTLSPSGNSEWFYYDQETAQLP